MSSSAISDPAPTIAVGFDVAVEGVSSVATLLSFVKLGDGPQAHEPIHLVEFAPETGTQLHTQSFADLAARLASRDAADINTVAVDVVSRTVLVYRAG